MLFARYTKGVWGSPKEWVYSLNPAVAYLVSREELHERLSGFWSPPLPYLTNEVHPGVSRITYITNPNSTVLSTHFYISSTHLFYEVLYIVCHVGHFIYKSIEQYLNTELKNETIIYEFVSSFPLRTIPVPEMRNSTVEKKLNFQKCFYNLIAITPSL